ncbi:MAG: metallopeptidase family protein [Dehalococcoidia bacterium]|nr:metallopeptidase family protein [Dehalococcoidia bacterium]MBK7124596.1 metallopeptidase family protein [Dehalococcoidia bacterium]
MERAEFRRLVREAVASLPPDLLKSVHNVDIVIERRPTARDRKQAKLGPGGLLLGLYHGIPLTKRGEYYNLVAPDKISIYQEHIEAVCRDDDEIREQVRKTVLHELGHYFGIDDDRLHQLGMG